MKVSKGNAQAFAEISDPRIMTATFGENNGKSDKLFKDAEDIGAKAKKIEKREKFIGGNNETTKISSNGF